MASETQEGSIRVFGLPVVLSLLVLILLLFSESLYSLVLEWWNSEEYGHGLFMPFIGAYILWSKRGEISRLPLRSATSGVICSFLGLTLYVSAVLADLESVKHYSFIIVLTGYVLFIGGWALFRIALVPLALLVLVIPLPYLLISSLTAGLQLISSEMGTWMIRAMGIPVFLEGNIIDLGAYKLQVVEACSGLRYLYPLISIALIVAYFLRAPLWFKAFLIVSTVPVTIVMNSLRIAVTGLLVKSFGVAAAEGFLHDFEGWVVFMAAFLILIAEVWLYKLIFKSSQSIFDLFDFGDDSANNAYSPIRFCISMIKVVFFVIPVVVLGGLANYYSVNEQIIIPTREKFNSFPMRIGSSNVDLSYLEQEVLDILRADDYFLGSYRDSSSEEEVNLYMVYYEQQKDGSALHSPKVCIPGGGWVVADESVVEFNYRATGETKAANRVVIRKGEFTQLVYYWIDQKGVSYTDEYLARASLISSAVFDKRSDGALIRVNVLVNNDDFDKADMKLQNFIRDMAIYLPDFLPQ
ncbi:VPLPA-CTERM-specific exosortase XrtD [Amphritea sp.]|uniref:VPLPA-CTERM-specific exosortase XrtD n=1 Tax=Amphritea sp. TaxID=1872502 RepID=UPI0025C0C2C4|nr:VPLPA-CTERM-specific exosortase XrtD [Amphritea sp.]